MLLTYMETGMREIVVRAYKASGGGHELLAVIPLSGANLPGQDGRHATDNELIAITMVELRNQGRFSDAEIEAFQYRVDRPRYPAAPEVIPELPQETTMSPEPSQAIARPSITGSST
ncbi:hypothetical protein GB927_018875 [Shinella sp. CPCC 100929]|uniref:Uncharacterized protein n=2 Tax=Shinella lacus TaxID=2654216 RepID=A0ABT1RAA4_9HYPH|nr:hypothetical protein [Shinella lacus]